MRRRLAHVPAAALVGLTLSLAWAPTTSATVVRVAPGTADLQGVLDSARAGDIVELGPGVWSGPLVLRTAVTLRGAGAVLDGGSVGTVLRIEAPSATVEGLTIRDSGDDLQQRDACVFVTKDADAATLADNHLSGCAFGIWVNKTRHVRILRNRVVGSVAGHRSNRGNGIHLFDSQFLVVAGNEVSGGRDGIYVSATEHSVIVDNRLEGTRYGVHYMFSYDNTITGNMAIGNASGIALMGSIRLLVTGNYARGNEEHGILFRDVQYTTIAANTVEQNNEGLFFYSSTDNVIMGNQIIQNAVGAKIWAGSIDNRVSGNVFSANRRQIFYVAQEDLELGGDAPGNLWGDYLGWDQDGDGIGDRPYKVDNFSTHLVYKYPAAALLVRSPALELLGFLQDRMPVLRIATVVDRQPLMRAPAYISEAAPRGLP